MSVASLITEFFPAWFSGTTVCHGGQLLQRLKETYLSLSHSRAPCFLRGLALDLMGQNYIQSVSRNAQSDNKPQKSIGENSRKQPPKPLARLSSIRSLQENPMHFWWVHDANSHYSTNEYSNMRTLSDSQPATDGISDYAELRPNKPANQGLRIHNFR